MIYEVRNTCANLPDKVYITIIFIHNLLIPKYNYRYYALRKFFRIIKGNTLSNLCLNPCSNIQACVAIHCITTYDLPTVLSFQRNRNLIELYKTYILKARQRKRLQYAVKCLGRAGSGSWYECNNFSEALPRPLRNYSRRNC